MKKNKLVKSMKSVNRNKHRSKTQVLWTLVFLWEPQKHLLQLQPLSNFNFIFNLILGYSDS